LAGLPVGIDALLQGGVVERAPLPQQEVQRFALSAVGIETVLEGADHSLPPRVVDGAPDRRFGDVTDAGRLVGAAPPGRQAGAQAGKRAAQHPRRVALEAVDDLRHRPRRIAGHEPVDGVGEDLARQPRDAIARRLLRQQDAQALSYPIHPDGPPVCGAPDPVVAPGLDGSGVPLIRPMPDSILIPYIQSNAQTAKGGGAFLCRLKATVPSAQIR
jgi:hypothetical protein